MLSFGTNGRGQTNGESGWEEAAISRLVLADVNYCMPLLVVRIVLPFEDRLHPSFKFNGHRRKHLRPWLSLIEGASAELHGFRKTPAADHGIDENVLVTAKDIVKF